MSLSLLPHTDPPPPPLPLRRGTVQTQTSLLSLPSFQPDFVWEPYCSIFSIELVVYVWSLEVLKGLREGVLADGERLSCSMQMSVCIPLWAMNIADEAYFQEDNFCTSRRPQEITKLVIILGSKLAMGKNRSVLLPTHHHARHGLCASSLLLRSTAY